MLSPPAVSKCLPSAANAADRAEPFIFTAPTHVRDFSETSGTCPSAPRNASIGSFRALPLSGLCAKLSRLLSGLPTSGATRSTAPLAKS